MFVFCYGNFHDHGAMEAKTVKFQDDYNNVFYKQWGENSFLKMFGNCKRLISLGVKFGH